MLNAFNTITIYIYTYIQRYYHSGLANDIQRYYHSGLPNVLTQDITSDIKGNVVPKYQLHVWLPQGIFQKILYLYLHEMKEDIGESHFPIVEN